MLLQLWNYKALLAIVRMWFNSSRNGDGRIHWRERYRSYSSSTQSPNSSSTCLCFLERGIPRKRRKENASSDEVAFMPCADDPLFVGNWNLARLRWLLHRLVVSLTIQFHLVQLWQLHRYVMRLINSYYWGRSERIVNDHQVSGIFNLDDAKEEVFINCWKQPTLRLRPMRMFFLTKTCSISWRWCHWSQQSRIGLEKSSLQPKRTMSRGTLPERTLLVPWFSPFQLLFYRYQRKQVHHSGKFQHTLRRLTFFDRGNHNLPGSLP